jgi:hypothetical protein
MISDSFAWLFFSVLILWRRNRYFWFNGSTHGCPPLRCAPLEVTWALARILTLFMKLWTAPNLVCWFFHPVFPQSSEWFWDGICRWLNPWYFEDFYTGTRSGIWPCAIYCSNVELSTNNGVWRIVTNAVWKSLTLNTAICLLQQFPASAGWDGEQTGWVWMA